MTLEADPVPFQVNDRTWRLYQDVVVPAALGNTAWALLTILVRDGFSWETTAKGVSLALLTLFFVGDWNGGFTGTPTIRSRAFLVFTPAFYLSIATYAIVTAEVSTTDRLSASWLGVWLLITGAGPRFATRGRVSQID